MNELSKKKIVSLNLVLHIFSFIDKDNNPSIIIPLSYYENHTQSSCFVNKSSTLSSVEAVANIPVKRIRKKPVTKMSDFLMEI
jgi:hypothetical protein